MKSVAKPLLLTIAFCDDSCHFVLAGGEGFLAVPSVASISVVGWDELSGVDAILLVLFLLVYELL